MSSDEKARELLVDLRNILEAWIGKVDLAFGENRQHPQEVKMPDMTKLPWIQVPAPQNPKGPWEKCVESAKPEFKEMQALIDAKNGPLYSGGFLYWLDQNKTWLGRRLKKK